MKLAPDPNFPEEPAKTNKIIATKALACKLAKAAWHIMSQQCDYDPTRVFPELAGPARKKQA